VADSFSDAASFDSGIKRMERALSDSLGIEMTTLKEQHRDAFDQAQKDEGDTKAGLLTRLVYVRFAWETPSLLQSGQPPGC
jgi:hypothetical protein